MSEKETLIPGCYVPTGTGSVTWLGAFAALQLPGPPVSPLDGLMGDRVGHRRVLPAMRATDALPAALVPTGAALAGWLGMGSPAWR